MRQPADLPTLWLRTFPLDGDELRIWEDPRGTLAGGNGATCWDSALAFAEAVCSRGDDSLCSPPWPKAPWWPAPQLKSSEIGSGPLGGGASDLRCVEGGCEAGEGVLGPAARATMVGRRFTSGHAPRRVVPPPDL